MEQILQSFFDIPFAAPILYGLVIWWPFKVYLRRVFAPENRFDFKQKRALLFVEMTLFILIVSIPVFILPIIFLVLFFYGMGYLAMHVFGMC